MSTNPRTEALHARPPEWLVVANAARARIFERDEGSGALREIADAVHPASREKASALAHDRPGHALKGGASTAFAPRTAPQARERRRFAQELAHLLEGAAQDRRMPGLVLLASNPFLGDLKASLGPASRSVLKAAVALDLSGLPAPELEHRVRQLCAEQPDSAAAALP